MKLLYLLVSCVLLHTALSANPAEQTTEFWESVTQFELDETRRIFDSLKTGKAKNVIMLIGDGMSLGTVTAGRIAVGQKAGMDGEEFISSLDSMPHSGIAKTYSVNSQTPDSASTATAFLSGVKTNSGMLGVNAKGNSCTRVNENSVTSSLEYAIMAGKSTGVVTTTRVQHATPAATYAHASRRSHYSDNHMSSTERQMKDQCPDIATQLFNKRRDIQVILGGGRSHMTPRSVVDVEYSTKRGERLDGRNLIEEWNADLNSGNTTARYVYDKTGFDNVDPTTTDYLMGLFSPYEMQFSVNREQDIAGEPTLAEMTEKAIRILQKNENGFFLLVESGLIDKGHHGGRAKWALEEFHELEKAVAKARMLTDEDETLIVTTADHGHMFMFGGNSVRGNNVYGLAPSHSNPSRAVDQKFYTTIVYGNGPGHAALRNRNAPRQSVQPWVVTGKWYRQQAAVPLWAETHSAEDVMVFGSGPMAHLLTGVHEQTHIASVVMYAACLGPRYENSPHCSEDNGTDTGAPDREGKEDRFIGEIDDFVVDDI